MQSKDTAYCWLTGIKTICRNDKKAYEMLTKESSRRKPLASSTEYTICPKAV